MMVIPLYRVISLSCCESQHYIYWKQKCLILNFQWCKCAKTYDFPIPTFNHFVAQSTIDNHHDSFIYSESNQIIINYYK